MQYRLFFMLFAVGLALLAPSATARVVTSLDGEWRFHQGDVPGAERRDYDDSAWRFVTVPHDWSIEGPFDEKNPAAGEGAFLPTGAGWYRRSFSLPEEQKGTRVVVEFDGVMANSDVWINGRHLGRRPNGYVSFHYDLSDHVTFGGDMPNTLVVRADTSQQVASRWYAGSGIYRHVRLKCVAPLHVEPWGVFVTTPSVSPKKATVQLAVSIRNQGGATQAVTVRTRLIDENGQEAAATEGGATIEAGKQATVQQRLNLNAPLLWDVDHPHMYSAVTSVVVDGATVDEVATPFGVRQAEFRPDTGFWLNGRALKIKGVCLHHDGGALGAAVPLAAWQRRLEAIRVVGVNAVRTAHNPPAPELLDLCDRMGFLVMDEVFDCWAVGKRRYDYHLYFNEWSRRDLRDTIRRDRNHPSVILYSVGNEIHDTPHEEAAKKILRGLVDVCHAADPTRPVTQGLFRPNVSHDYDNGLADILDVIGTNYRDQELLDAWRKKPTRKIIGTEQTHERSTWLLCRDNPQHAGQFLWVGVDYLGESPRWPITTFNSGLLDRTGLPHPRGYERQSWWSDKPMVRAFRRAAPTDKTPVDPGYEAVEWQRRQALFPDWTPADLSAHEEEVEVYSNCEEVELLIDGKSQGAKKLPADAGARRWRVGFEPGALVAIARNGGQEVARDELRTAGRPHAIVLIASRDELTPDWDDVAYVEAQIVDDHGVLVPTAADTVTFAVSGPGRVIAVDSGSIVSHEPFQAAQRRAFQGRLIAVIRAVANSGAIRVTAEAPGLQPGAIEVEADAN